MAPVDPYGEDNVETLARTKLHMIDGRVSFRPRETVKPAEPTEEGEQEADPAEEGEQEAAPAETKTQLGNAQASEYSSERVQAMVSIVQEACKILDGHDKIGAFQAMLPTFVFSEDELEQMETMQPFILGPEEASDIRPLTEAYLPSDGTVRAEYADVLNIGADSDVVAWLEMRRVMNSSIGPLLEDPLDEYSDDTESDGSEDEPQTASSVFWSHVEDQEQYPRQQHFWDGVWSDLNQLRPRRPRSLSLDNVSWERPVLTKEARQEQTKELRAVARQHIDQAWTEKAAIKPDTDHILREYYRLAMRYPRLQHLTRRNVAIVRDHFRYSLKWDITKDRIWLVLGERFRCTSFGKLPYLSCELEKAKEEEAHLASLKELPQGRDQKAAAKKAAKKKEQEDRHSANDKRFILRQKMAMTYQPKTLEQRFGVGDILHEEGVNLRLTLVKDERVRSFVRLSFDFLYILPGVAKQPRHTATVILTERNARYDTLERGDNAHYYGYHTVTNVNDPMWDERLQKLFPHVRSGFFKDQRENGLSDHQRLLISVPHNKEPYTSNVFTDNPGMPVGHQLLQRCMRQSESTMHILIRAPLKFEEKIHEVFQQFDRQTTYNPLSQFFVDPTMRIIGPKTVLPLKDRPHFTAMPTQTFDSWEQYKLQMGLGAYFELDWQYNHAAHKADAVFYPVPMLETERYGPMAYFVIATLTNLHETKDMPALTPGTRVKVVMKQDQVIQDENFHTGQVIDRIELTRTSTITLLIYRRRIPKTNDYVEGQLSDYTASDLETMSAAKLRKDAPNHLKAITIRPQPDGKDMSRQMRALARFFVPPATTIQRPEFDMSMEQHRLLLQCGDPQSLVHTSLWKGCRLSDVKGFTKYLHDRLEPQQQQVVQEWLNNGLRDHTAALSGVSGVGKSYLAHMVAMPYLGNVEVPSHVMTQIEHERTIAREGAAHAEKQMEKRRDDTQDTPEDEDENDDVEQQNDDGEGIVPSGKRGKKEKKPLPEIPTVPDAVEKGRILAVAALNVTVDHMHKQFTERAITTCKDVGLPPPLSIRLHSFNTERKAVMAMTNPMYDDGPQSLWAEKDLDNETLGCKLRRTFQTFHHGSEYREILDARFVCADTSMARYVCQLGGLWDVSPELKAAFSTPKELEDAMEQCDLTRAAGICADSDGHTEESAKLVKKHGRRAMDILLRKASIITTTPSVAHESRLHLQFHPHAIVIEEAGRLSDAQMWALFSLHWTAQFRLLVGDWRQLGPMQFCPMKLNPFAAQISISLLKRFQRTGMRVQELTQTRRFGNEQLLTVCRLVNDLPDIKMVPTADRPEETSQVNAHNEDCYLTPRPLVLINIPDAEATRLPNGSWMCDDTACVSVYEAQRLLLKKAFSGKGHQVTIVSHYNGQVDRLRQARDELVRLAKVQSRRQLAEDLEAMTISTVDSYMGNENLYVFVDLVGRIGFLEEETRMVVTFTRAAVGMWVVGNLYKITDEVRGDLHPINRILRKFQDQIYTMSAIEMAQRTNALRHVFQEDSATEPKTLAQLGAFSTSILEKAPEGHTADYDNEDEDMSKLCKEHDKKHGNEEPDSSGWGDFNNASWNADPTEDPPVDTDNEFTLAPVDPDNEFTLAPVESDAHEIDTTVLVTATPVNTDNESTLAPIDPPVESDVQNTTDLVIAASVNTDNESTLAPIDPPVESDAHEIDTTVLVTAAPAAIEPTPVEPEETYENVQW